MIIESRAAHRYAKAMLDIAREQGILDTIVEDFRTLEYAIVGSRDLRNLLATPVIDAERKTDLILEIFQGKVSGSMVTFLRLLTKKGRAPMLLGAAVSFRNQLDQDRGVLTAEVSTAVELNDELKNNLETQLAGMTGKTIQANYHIDPDLIGGFVARVDDRMIDASVRHQLERLHDSLVGEAGTWSPSL